METGRQGGRGGGLGEGDRNKEREMGTEREGGENWERRGWNIILSEFSLNSFIEAVP